MPAPGIYWIGDLELLFITDELIGIATVDYISISEREKIKATVKEAFPSAKLFIWGVGHVGFTPLDKAPEFRAAVESIVSELMGS